MAKIPPESTARVQPPLARDEPRGSAESRSDYRDHRNDGMRSDARDTRDARSNDNRDTRKADTRDARDAGPRDSQRDLGSRDAPRETRDSPRDGGARSTPARRDDYARDDRRPAPASSGDMNRLPARQDPSGGRPALEHRARPSILGGDRSNNSSGSSSYHHARPSFTASLRQPEPGRNRLDNVGRSDAGPHASSAQSGSSSSSAATHNPALAQQPHGTIAPHPTHVYPMQMMAGFMPHLPGAPFPGHMMAPFASNEGQGYAGTSSAAPSGPESSMSPVLEPPSMPATPLPSKTEIILGIEEKEDTVVEVLKQVETLRKEKDKLAKEVHSSSNAKHRGKLLHLVPGLPIRPELLSTPTSELIRETYYNNLRLSVRAESVEKAQLCDDSGDLRVAYAPFIKHLADTSKQFQYLSIAARNIALAEARSAASTPGPRSDAMEVDEAPAQPVSAPSTSVASPNPTENQIANGEQPQQHLPLSASAPPSIPSNGAFEEPPTEAVNGAPEPANMTVPEEAPKLADDSTIFADAEFLPLEPGVESPPVIDEATFFNPVTAPPISDYSFVKDNLVLHDQLKEAMVTSLVEKRRAVIEKTAKAMKAHRKAQVAWCRRMQLEREEEASRRLLQNKKWLHLAQSGRKFSVRASARITDSPTSAASTPAKKKSVTPGVPEEEEEEDFDPERFESTRAYVPPMLEFDEDANDHIQFMVDNDGFVEDSRAIDQDIKLLRPWYPEEEDVFVRAFLRYHKDFVKIKGCLPTKSLQEIIWFYYTRKNKLDLKRRWQREGMAQQMQQLNTLGVASLSADDPAAATLAHYMGSTVEWVNGASRRGSLRLLEKGTAEKTKPAPTRYTEDVDVDIERSYYDSAPHSPGRTSVGGTPSETINRWSQEERDKFKAAFDIHYKDFKSIADIMKTKNAAQCKNYYHNNKKKLGLPAAALKNSGTISEAKSSPPTSPRAPSAAGSLRESQNVDITTSAMDVDVTPQPTTTASSAASTAELGRLSPSFKSEEADESPLEHSGEVKTSSGLELASPMPKRGGAARINTSHWSDEEKNKFKALLQQHGKDWKQLAAGISTKTVSQIKNFFQNYRSKLKLDDLLPETERGASARGGRGRKRKVKPRGRPKKTGAGGYDEEDSELDSDMSETGDEEDYEMEAEEAAPSGSHSAPPSTTAAPTKPITTSSDSVNTSGHDQESTDLPTSSVPGKRKRDEALGPSDATEAPSDEEDEAAAAAPEPALVPKRGRGGKTRGTRGRGGASASATPPATKKKKTIQLEDDAIEAPVVETPALEKEAVDMLAKAEEAEERKRDEEAEAGAKQSNETPISPPLNVLASISELVPPPTPPPSTDTLDIKSAATMLVEDSTN